jgi:hypothetical protein
MIKTFVRMMIMLWVLTAPTAVAQTPEEMVTVPRKYVSSEGLDQAKTGSAVSPYLGMGREIGEAVKGGLESVVDVSNRFADTPVGKFTLVMIAWKVIGQDLLGVVLGLPLYLMLLSIWLHFVRMMFFGRWVKRLVDGKKQHVFQKPMEFQTADSKFGSAWALIIIGVLLNVSFLNIIF